MSAGAALPATKPGITALATWTTPTETVVRVRIKTGGCRRLDFSIRGRSRRTGGRACLRGIRSPGAGKPKSQFSRSSPFASRRSPFTTPRGRSWRLLSRPAAGRTRRPQASSPSSRRIRDHVSNLYEDAEMPFMQRVTWSGIALHAGALPGYRASHGCIRLPYRFAERLFDLTSVGTRVVIAPNKVDAMRVSHPLLDRLQRDGAMATSASGVEQAREAATRAREEADAVAARAEKVAAAARRAEAAKARALKRLSAAEARVAAQKSGRAKVRAEAQVQKLRADASVAAAAAKRRPNKLSPN